LVLAFCTSSGLVSVLIDPERPWQIRDRGPVAGRPCWLPGGGVGYGRLPGPPGL